MALLTISLLVAISNIVIWGYGEIAVGMWVGCLSTLRPLFRKLFSLGSLGSTHMSRGHTGTGPHAGFPSNARRTYDQFSGQRDIEMDGMGTTSKAFKSSAKSENTISTEVRASVSSETDSIEHIFKESQKQGVLGSGGIVVSRQVQIRHSDN